MKRLLNILMLCALLAMMTACRREPLHDEYVLALLDLEIDLDILHRPNYPEPETMLILYYDPEARNYVQRDYTGPKGGELSVYAGDYDIFIYNFDTGRTEIRSLEQSHTIVAYTYYEDKDVSRLYNTVLSRYSAAKDGGTHVDSAGNQPIIRVPDNLFMGRIPRASVPLLIDYEEPIVLHARAETIVQSWRIEISPVTGAQYIKSAEIFLTGQKRSRLLGSGDHAPGPAATHFPVALDAEDNKFFAIFNTFGKYLGEVSDAYLLVTDIRGGRYLYRYDVTDQFDDLTNNGRLIIINSSVDIPEPKPDLGPGPGQSGGGFDPEVNRWNEIIHEIHI